MFRIGLPAPERISQYEEIKLGLIYFILKLKITSFMGVFEKNLITSRTKIYQNQVY